MRQLFTLVLVIISAISYGQSYPDSGFKIAFPAKPSIESKIGQTKFGEMKGTIYSCEVDGYSMMIAESKFPSELIEKLSTKSEDGKRYPGIEGLLNGGKNGALKNLSTQMGLELENLSDENFLFKGTYHALKTKAKIGEHDALCLNILKNNQMYLVIIIGDVTGKGAEDFLNSFEFL